MKEILRWYSGMILVVKTVKNLVRKINDGFQSWIKTITKKASARKIQRMIKRAMRAKDPSLAKRQN